MQSIFTEQEDFFELSFEAILEKSARVEEKQFELCNFRKCDFSEALFQRCQFTDCTFEDCDLSNLKMNATALQNVSFRHCKMMGINWTHATSITHANFENSVLDYSTFVGMDLRKSILRACSAREADFADANFSEVDFRGTDFFRARFANTNLQKADLRQARNYSIRPDENKLKKAKFSLPEATLLLHGLDILLEE